MIRDLYWHRLPSQTTLEMLPRLMWSKDGELTPASTTMALMLYVALHFMAEELFEEAADGTRRLSYIASASYDDLMLTVTAKSRSKVADGLKRLVNLGLIERVGSHQQRRYRLTHPEGAWFKLPCQAIVRGGVILPFRNFTLRSRDEFHALKVYLYLAARRPNDKTYTVVSYDKIVEATGVPRRDLRKALNTMNLCGLLADIDREREAPGKGPSYGPNLYYLSGHHQLFQSSTRSDKPSQDGSPAAMPVNAASADAPQRSRPTNYADHL